MPVVGGTPDIASAAIGSGAVRDYEGAPLHRHVVVAVLPRAVQEDRLLSPVASLPSALPGRYFVANEQETAGACVEWLRDNAPVPATDRTRGARPRLDAVAARTARQRRRPVHPVAQRRAHPVADPTCGAACTTCRCDRPAADLVALGARGRGLQHPLAARGSPSGSEAPARPTSRSSAAGPTPRLWRQIHADVLDRPIPRSRTPCSANARGAAFWRSSRWGSWGGRDAPRLKVAALHRRAANRGTYDELFAAFLDITGAPAGLQPPELAPRRARVTLSYAWSVFMRDPWRRSSPGCGHTAARSRPSGACRTAAATARRCSRDGGDCGARRRAGRTGYVSGAVYHGDPEHIAFLDQVYALNSQTNPLHADLWPSTTKFEAEIVAMTADMLHGTDAGAGASSPRAAPSRYQRRAGLARPGPRAGSPSPRWCCRSPRTRRSTRPGSTSA